MEPLTAYNAIQCITILNPTMVCANVFKENFMLGECALRFKAA